MRSSQQELMQLLRLAETSDSLNIDIELGQKRIRIAKGDAIIEPIQGSRITPGAEKGSHGPDALQVAPSPVSTDQNGAAELIDDDLTEGLILRAPIAGTFYRSPSPSSPAYCEVGDKISSEDVLGLIEVMKLFNSISAGANGTIARFFASNAQQVAQGDPLIQVVVDDSNQSNQGNGNGKN